MKNILPAVACGALIASLEVYFGVPSWATFIVMASGFIAGKMHDT